MIGETLAHYRITQKIGAGGMGEVYRATDSKLHRDVAIKVISASLRQRPRAHGPVRARSARAGLAQPRLDRRRVRPGRRQRQQGAGDGAGGGDRPLRPAQAGPVAPRPRRCAPPRRLPRRSKPRTSTASSTATSSPPTSSCCPDGRIKLLDFGLAKALEAGVGRSAGRLGHAQRRRDPGRHRHGHRRLHESGAGHRRARWTSAPTSGPSAWCCSRCSPGSACSKARPRRTRWRT